MGIFRYARPKTAAVSLRERKNPFAVMVELDEARKARLATPNAIYRQTIIDLESYTLHDLETEKAKARIAKHYFNGYAYNMSLKPLADQKVLLSYTDMEAWKLKPSLDYKPDGGLSVTDKITYGEYVTGEPVQLELAKEGYGGNHLLIAGATGSGKSSAAKVIVEQINRRKNTNIIALDCSGKGLEDFSGKSAISGVFNLGVIADNREQILAFLQSFREFAGDKRREYTLKKYGRRKWQPTDELNHWTLYLEEYSYLFEGLRGKSLDEMVDLIESMLKQLRSAGVSVVAVTQQASKEQLGSTAIRDSFMKKQVYNCSTASAGFLFETTDIERGMNPAIFSDGDLPGGHFTNNDANLKYKPARAYWLKDVMTPANAPDALMQEFIDKWSGVIYDLDAERAMLEAELNELEEANA